MCQDKQLRGISLDEVAKKRQLDQALNAKEFAVLAGISYSAARTWFRRPGFPVVGGVVFWLDFVAWRKHQTGLDQVHAKQPDTDSNSAVSLVPLKPQLPARAMQILREAAR